jgi:hypothetical protein
LNLLGYSGYCPEVTGRRDREPRLDDVHAQSGELHGDSHLLVGIEGDAGGLLAVSEGAVENPYSVFHVVS